MQKLIRALVVVALAVGIGIFIWMILTALGRVQNAVIATLFAALFAYAIFPAVRFLSARMPRAIAVLIVYVLSLGALGFAGAYLAPTIAAESLSLARTFPSAVQSIEAQLEHPASNSVLNRLPPEVRALVVHNAAQAAAIGGSVARYLGERTVELLRGALTFFVDMLLVFTLAFFFITDAERIRKTALRLVPRDAKASAARFIDESDRVVSAFVRGQLVLAAITAIAVTLALALLHVPYAVLLGVLAGVASVVPIVGELVSALLTFLVAIVTVGPLQALIALGLFVAVFEVQGRVLAPIVVGKSVGVSPLVVFIAILVGAESFGIVGMVLAVPAAAILRVALDQLAPSEPLVDISSSSDSDRTEADGRAKRLRA
jgi:predicted PurR-regulated permease PerM